MCRETFDVIGASAKHRLNRRASCGPDISQTTFDGALRNPLSLTKSSSRIPKMNASVRAIPYTEWTLAPSWPRPRT